MDNQSYGDYIHYQLLGEGLNTKSISSPKRKYYPIFCVKVFSGPYLNDASFKKRLERDLRLPKVFNTRIW